MRCIVVKTSDTKAAATVLEEKLSITDYKVIDSSEIRVYERSAAVDIINRELIRADVSVSGISEAGISLEDYFKQLVGEESK